MKRFCLILLVLLLLYALPVAAAEEGISGTVIVSPEGSAQFKLEVTLAQAADSFPLPKNAENILLNGQQADNPVDIRELTHFRLEYTLPSVAKEQKDGSVLLTLPILAGFEQDVPSMQLTAILPDKVENSPVFTSGYHGTSIASQLVCTRSENTISAMVTAPLKNHETLTMTLEAPATMFPQLTVNEPLLTLWEGGILALTVLGILYYGIFLLPALPKKMRCCTPPEGITAGHVGSCLTGSGPDLTMMVITWAQLGYLSIHLKQGRVTLHKLMDMGNERSGFETRVFQRLFRSRMAVSGNSMSYAKLYRLVSAQKPLQRQLFSSRNGSLELFRAIMTLVGVLCGITMGMAVNTGSSGKALLAVVFGLLCGVFSFFIQSGGRCLPLQDKSPMHISLICGGLWLVLGLLMGKPLLSIAIVGLQFLAGFGIAYGGKRSQRGQRCLSELLSLRRFMLKAQPEELQRMLRTNPNFFSELIPYAMAMGVDKQFARRFGKTLLPEQSFVETDGTQSLNASQLASRLGVAVDSLNALQKRLRYRPLPPRQKD